MEIIYEGQCELFGVSVSLSEAETHWRQFLQSLMEQGMHDFPGTHHSLAHALDNKHGQAIK